MSLKAVQSVRGMPDILPPESDQRQQLMAKIEAILHQFGYRRADLPLLEKTTLFKRTIGDETDIVAKEMYSFHDRNDESLTLRPEATAGVVRSMIENGLLQQVQRLFVAGPMFRYERPQKGRYRQFTQVSVESFGIATAAIDVELMQIGDTLFRALGLRDRVTLEINTLGLLEERQAYKKALTEYLERHKDALDEDSSRRLYTNPLRILDSKNADVRACLDGAPVLDGFLGEISKTHFLEVRRLLDGLSIPYRHNPLLVRGLDYYGHSVFEWTTDALGAQGGVCAGGRYDGLVAHLGGKSTPAAGFAFGLERIFLLARHHETFPELRPDFYVLAASSAEQIQAMRWAARLRAAFPSLCVVVHNEFPSLKNQFKKADKSGARYALVFAAEEIAAGQATLKNLATGEQTRMTFEQLSKMIEQEKTLP